VAARGSDAAHVVIRAQRGGACSEKEARKVTVRRGMSGCDRHSEEAHAMTRARQGNTCSGQGPRKVATRGTEAEARGRRGGDWCMHSCKGTGRGTRQGAVSELDSA